jgi:hypothetical protein
LKESACYQALWVVESNTQRINANESAKNFNTLQYHKIPQANPGHAIDLCEGETCRRVVMNLG